MHMLEHLLLFREQNRAFEPRARFCFALAAR